MRGVRKLVDHVTLAISFIGSFVFFSGVLILAGSIAMTKFQRVYEAAVLKTSRCAPELNSKNADPGIWSVGNVVAGASVQLPVPHFPGRISK